MRLVIKYGGKTISLYISPDAELKNGYMTFTRSTGDEAFGEADIIDIQHAQDSASQFQVNYNDTGAQITHPPISAAVPSDFVGKTITPQTLMLCYTAASDARPVESDVALSAKSYWDIQFESSRDYLSWSACEFIKGDKGSIWTMRNDPIGQQYRQSMKDEGKWDGSTPFFFFAPTGTGYFTAIFDYTFDGSEVFQLKNRNLAAGKYDSGYVAATFDDPFDVKFKLTTNAFKSQQGDTTDIRTDKSVNIAGVYMDDTEFNFNAIII